MEMHAGVQGGVVVVSIGYGAQGRTANQVLHIDDLKRMVEISFNTLEQQRIANLEHGTAAD